MQSLTDEGQKIVADIAARHGVSSEAVTSLAAALAAGGGRQAQFDHPDLGGMGQWSQGGMIMIGDMFNHGLKAKVAALCDDLAAALQKSSLFATATGSSGSRWPAELGTPSSTGSQNDMHYAVFPGARRLAIEQGGRTTIYDTGDHRIGGVSQQQSGDQSLSFTSQSGPVRLSELKQISSDAVEPSDPAPARRAASATLAETPSVPRATGGGSQGEDIFMHIERLADLRNRDIITAEEFAAKKTELLSRL